MNLPTYVKDKSQENYHEELNQTLRQGLGVDGFTISQVTNAQLTVNPYVLPDGTVTTLALAAPDGSMFYVTDHAPPVFAGKINGALVQFATNPYP
jgi:hypothetical protein